MRERSAQLVYLLAALVLVTFSDIAGAAQVEAIAGQPFGVAQITLPFPVQDIGLPIGRAAMMVEGPEGRVHYPAVTDGVVKRLLGRDSRQSANLTVNFLFQGDTPFDVTISTPTRQTVSVTPQRKSESAHNRMLRRWWRGYNSLFRDVAHESEHPPLIETYLTSMLARRLGLDALMVEQLESDARKSQGYQSLELLAGAEAVRMQIVKATSLGVLPSAVTADLPLPLAIDWRLGKLPESDDDVVVEPLAMRVPEECFYVRFGQYSNFLWLNALMEDYGGEIGSMISAHGYRSGLNLRIQDQLAMQQGVLAELLGPQAIADVAAIGLDTFTREGAAVGAIFEAKGTLLGIDLARQRQEALFREKDNGSSLKTVKISGRDVSFLSTPDNRLRSFYLVDGKYHLVTNSRVIVERFLEVADGNGSLGANKEYRYARSVVPTSREDTIFIYFSSAFFRNLLSPHYQIEMHRRLQATTDIELITLAQLAAKAEGAAGATIEELIAAQVLPARFAQRADQSRPVISDKRIIDSLRGERGYFTPVPDVQVEAVSAEERQRFENQASYFAKNWQQVDPVLVALKRYALDKERGERITLDAFITPMDDFKYQVLMSMLGEPSSHKLVPPDDNVILIDATVRGGILFPSVPPHRLFLSVQDHEALTQSKSQNVLKLLQIIRTAPAYLGGWPKPGFLDLLPLGSRTPDEDGFSQLPLGLLRWQGRGFSVLAMDKEILTQAGQRLGFVEEDQPAQIRVRVSDLSKAKFGSWLNQMGYERARQVSVTNTRLMSVLTQQLKVPLAESRQITERLLDATLVCSLGGQYEIASQGTGQQWRSTAWPTSYDYTLPADYVTPPLDWFRGLEGRLAKYPDRLVIHANIDMQRKERDSAIKLPFFDMFGEKKKTEPPKAKEY